MALSEETKRKARALGLPEPLPLEPVKPLTPEEADRIAKEWVAKYAPKWDQPYDEKTSSENTENEEIDPFD